MEIFMLFEGSSVILENKSEKNYIIHEILS